MFVIVLMGSFGFQFRSISKGIVGALTQIPPTAANTP